MSVERKDIHNSDIPVLCQACEARHKGVCGALSPEQLIDLNKQSVRKRVEPGVELLGETRQAESYANIISGVVKLTKMMADGRQQIVGLQFAPDFLGLTIETVSRQMTKLRKDEIILISNNRHVEVPNLTRLAERASQ